MPYIVKHNCLGMGPGKDKYNGDTVTEAELEEAGADVERLLELGAIAETGCSGCDIGSECGECDQQAGEPIEGKEAETVDIEKLTKAQLEDLADEMGLDLDPAKMSKAEMIEAITEAMLKETAAKYGIDIDGMDAEAIQAAIDAKQAEADNAD